MDKAPDAALILGDELDELCHKLGKLEQSQIELINFFEESPEDIDIKQAILENVDSLRMMNEKIDKLASLLPLTDKRRSLLTRTRVDIPIGRVLGYSSETKERDLISVREPETIRPSNVGSEVPDSGIYI